MRASCAGTVDYMLQLVRISHFVELVVFYTIAGYVSNCMRVVHRSWIDVPLCVDASAKGSRKTSATQSEYRTCHTEVLRAIEWLPWWEDASDICARPSGRISCQEWDTDARCPN
ncbi:hypothetical protein DAEQUDRAFT_216885 [Daedalea quercina L-15889]|uniref:Uncharacterized protein n=1 Tax=Daedalea quercina L-15889 TaxID=1314783 RepID=A0A165R4T9_9APHY|nr:hypothetical protein DAEQUDRAFT_216885 [Daedalea quercina L-15889]